MLTIRAPEGGQSVETANELGWSKLSNGELLAVAEAAAFGLHITTDQHLTQPRAVVEHRWRAGKLGTGTKISRAKALGLIKSLP